MGWTIVAALLACLFSAWPSLADDRGWGYLIDKLITDGVDRQQVVRTFEDRRVPPFDGLDFSLQRPREPRSLYRHFLRASSVAAARRCHARHADAFETTERSSNVPASVLAAILFVESGCGQNTGSSLILYRLARLAMANAPDNLDRNRARYTASDGQLDPVTGARLQERARYLEDTFYPEVRATFAIASRMGVDPLDIRGSPSGAFGYPQFLPTSYLEYGADGDGDGEVSLYNTADAAASTARYLVQHGWHSGLSAAQRRAVIWEYNRSAAYVDTVMTLAARIDGAPARRPRQNKSRARRGSHTHTTVACPTQREASAPL
jgi:membrane-bound lytic murein transglycosylase B